MKTTYNGNGCIPNQVLVAYLKGELNSKEAHMVERHVANCPMCTDELEGLSLLANPEQIHAIENKLNKQIDKRLASPFIHRANRTPWLRIAATLLLFVGVSSLVVWVSINNNRNDMFAEGMYNNDELVALSHDPVTMLPRLRDLGPDTTMHSTKMLKSIQSKEQGLIPTNQPHDTRPRLQTKMADEQYRVMSDATPTFNAEASESAGAMPLSQAQVHSKRAAGVAKTSDSTPYFAKSYYQNGDYAKALSLFESLPQSESSDSVSIYMATCYFNLSDYTNAMAHALPYVSSSTDPNYYKAFGIVVKSLANQDRTVEAEGYIERYELEGKIPQSIAASLKNYVDEVRRKRVGMNEE
ncbi:MAG: hypothetical protein JW783_03855 [Bacteroidales bacterium]|nr:hypothetical protein [Bacteroidales bacterium]MBN2748130.1 hypothetical protein [Bacteroidales bacterium]